MKKVRQTFQFIFEVMLFVFAGFYIAIGFNVGYFYLIFGFVMAYLTGKQIERDAVEEYKESQNGC